MLNGAEEGVMVPAPGSGSQSITYLPASAADPAPILGEMLHDASGPTWRQTCFLPAVEPDPAKVELTISVLGRFASHGGFDSRQTPPRAACLHIVHAGEGFFHSGGKELRVGAGGVFCFAPGVPVHYGDRRDRPWRY